MATPIELSGPIYKGLDDYTLYFPANVGRKAFRLSNKVMFRDGSVRITDKRGRTASGRGLACWCDDRRHVSVTIRLTERPRKGLPVPLWYDPSTVISESPFKARSDLDPICQRLFELLFQHTPRFDGLVVVSGRTGSLKSTTARGLIFKLLHDDRFCSWWNERKTRRPHLIVLEDPVEKPLYPPNADPFDEHAGTQRRVDYTARNRSRGDFRSLPQAFSDALRQTPAVVYVGEVRAKEDWKAVLDFAGTGHLVFTTTHAGSVVETFSRIFDATDARTTPALQGIVASRILGVIHQENIEVKDSSVASASAGRGATVAKRLLPALWRSTPAGVASLVAPGLSSILPHFEPSDSDRIGQISSFGRRFFNFEIQPPSTEFQAQLDQAALARDLCGI